MQLRCTAFPLPRARRSLRDPRKERWSLKLTRHNGRAGKHGTYNPKHNDRSFEITNSEHIDPERARQNIYWDCYNGIRSALQPKSEESLADTFEEVEKLYYKLHYTNFTEKQNERNAKIRHTERNRSPEDLLTSKKTRPEESIYQLGTLESHASPKELFQIATEFMDEFHEHFGKHVHILDWALHLDEGTPHIHERHVFDCANKYGEVAPQQEKALEALGFELPKPDKPLGRYNNRKITFDAACRTMLFEIAKRHGLELDEVPEYGGRAYLEKQDYILKKQNERIAEQKKEPQEQSIQYVGLLEDCRNQRDEYAELFNQAIRQSEEISKNNEKFKSQENELEELFSQWVDVNDLFNDAVNGSYDQAVLAVSDVGLNKALQEAVNEIDAHPEFPHIVFHGLRHSSATYQLMISGGDVKAVQGTTGHASANLLVNTYAHIQQDSRKKLGKKFEEGFYKPGATLVQATPVEAEPTISVSALLELLKDADPSVKAQLRLALLT